MTTVTHAGFSDPGRMRPDNEDRWLGDPRRGLYVIADGKAATAAGALTAQVVVDTLLLFLHERLADVPAPADPEAPARSRRRSPG